MYMNLYIYLYIENYETNLDYQGRNQLGFKDIAQWNPIEESQEGFKGNAD